MSLRQTSTYLFLLINKSAVESHAIILLISFIAKNLSKALLSSLKDVNHSIRKLIFDN